MEFTETFHLDTYPSLHPSRPELSQTNRTILITGGSGGVGLAIARGFIQARAKRIIIIARRAENLAEAKQQLEQAAGSDSDTEIQTYPADVNDAAGIQRVWDDLKAKAIGVDVLVLNAAVARTTPEGMEGVDVVEQMAMTFEVNVMSQVRMAKAFLDQGAKEGKAIVSVNASVVHISPVRPEQLGYTCSKTAVASFMQSMADSIGADKTQIISFHPGSILTEAVKKSQWANAPIAWNTDTLPGDFAVWAANPEARFLHGRFAWCNWDIEELRGMEGFKHPGFCKIGLQGPEMVSTDQLYTQMAERRKKDEQ